MRETETDGMQSAVKHERVNLRTPEIMARVEAEVESHYRSELVETIRSRGGSLTVGETTLRLAKEFGFCYGVERAIDLAYAARKVFPDARLFILGEIIHNPDVNRQIAAMGIRNLLGPNAEFDIGELTPDDVVIVPAFGSEVQVVEAIRGLGCRIVDTTCGDVMSVWRRVRQNANDSVTSIIHGKAEHEETRATASRALGSGAGHYLVVLDLEETRAVADFVVNGGDPNSFLVKFRGAHSPGFNPTTDLQQIGVANQTTMLRSETEEVQNLLRTAILKRDGSDQNFRFFDTICGATQERQDALFEMLITPPDLLLVVGGYNSSNTTHLAEIAEKSIPTFFIRNADCLISEIEIRHFEIHEKSEIPSTNWLPTGPLTIGVTAGASCPNKLIEDTLVRVLKLRGEEPPVTRTATH